MNIGFQLFSARNFLLDEVLKKVAALGYTWFEAAIGLVAMGTTLGLAYKLLYDYVRVKV